MLPPTTAPNSCTQQLHPIHAALNNCTQQLPPNNLIPIALLQPLRPPPTISAQAEVVAGMTAEQYKIAEENNPEHFTPAFSDEVGCLGWG